MEKQYDPFKDLQAQQLTYWEMETAETFREYEDDGSREEESCE